MLYLSEFSFPEREKESSFFLSVKRTCYDSYYPFQVLCRPGLETLRFEPMTILYGGNGSGKTTALNVMAEALGAKREAPYNRSSFFPDYLELCRAQLTGETPEEIRIITSEDVFDFMLSLRRINEGIDEKREELFDEYLINKRARFQLQSMEDYDQLKKIVSARRRTQSRYVRENLMDKVREHSNGESAFRCFTERIRENGLYLLDEPENSLSAARQRELAHWLEDSVRFFGCQFIIATHSPFLLAARDARIYDLDREPVEECPWTELEAIRVYRDFFAEHEKDLGRPGK